MGTMLEQTTIAQTHTIQRKETTTAMGTGTRATLTMIQMASWMDLIPVRKECCHGRRNP